MLSPRLVLKTVAALLLIGAVFYGVRLRRDFWDFEVYRTAGIRALAAEPLYRADDGHYQFKYWPAFALAMSPFGFLPDRTAKFVWFTLSIFLLGIFIRKSVRSLPDRRLSEGWLIGWILLVTAKFIVKELVNGQTNVLVGLLVLLAALAMDRARPRLAGVLIALATFIKPYALLLVPWLLVTGGSAALVTATVGLATGLLFPAVLYGWTGNLAQLGAWYTTVTDSTGPNLLTLENISFATMWAKWLGDGRAAWAFAAGSAVASLLLAAIVWKQRAAVAQPAYLEASILLLLMPLISPQGWDYVLLLATPGFVCLIDRFRDRASGWQVITVVGFVLTSLTVFDVVGRSMYGHLMAASAVSVGALLLMASLAHLRFRALA
ncbi:MAG: glycosyltransferase family 87 protein [Vicinamibacterales bacterium]